TLGKASLIEDVAAEGFETFGNKAEKAGAKVSVSTKKLAVDLETPVSTLVGLEHAGLQAGVSTEALDAALRKLGETGGDTGEKFIAMSGKMIPDADAVRLFGDSAADALKVLALGPEALRKSVKEATTELSEGLKG